MLSVVNDVARGEVLGVALIEQRLVQDALGVFSLYLNCHFLLRLVVVVEVDRLFEMRYVLKSTELDRLKCL